MPKILFIDDDSNFSSVTVRSLQRRSSELEFTLCEAPSEALRLCSTEKFDVAVCDLSLDSSGPDGGIKLVRELGACIERIIVLTGATEDQLGIEALANGAASFIKKPPETDHLFHLILDAVRYSELKRELKRNSEAELTLGFSSQSLAMRTTLADAAFASSNSQPVFLIGETGTGKGVLAKAIHQASNRKARNLVRCQPNFSNPDITSSELFGHVRGAFTGADREKEGLIRVADRGTLFIDEIDELPNETQVMLLNTLQEHIFRKVGSTKEERSDFRLISASNISEAELFAGKKLRVDFLHRIAHLKIRIPPLRERREDISKLAEEFLEKTLVKESIKINGFSQSSYAKLHTYHWPGNVRELEASVTGAATKAAYLKRAYIEPEDFNFDVDKPILRDSISFRAQVQTFEKQLVNAALEEADGNQSEAARMLQMDRASFRRVLSRD